MNTPPARRPQRVTLHGRYVRLEALAAAHTGDLFAQFAPQGEHARFEFLWDAPPTTLQALGAWVDAQAALDDPLFSAVVEQSSGRVLGRQALMRITPEHGVIEIGSILWGAAMARTRLATEALFLAARHVFDDLGYRRFEWKCDARNEPSRRAALRFGFRFEGIFRQHMWIKGRSRDTAWFAMLDHEWPALRGAFEAWLAANNFSADGQQLQPLAIPRV